MFRSKWNPKDWQWPNERDGFWIENRIIKISFLSPPPSFRLSVVIGNIVNAIKPSYPFVSVCCSVAAYRSTGCHSTEYTYGISLRWLHTHTHNILHTPSYSVVQFSRKVGNESGGRKGRKRILVAIKSLLVLLPTPPLFLSLYNAWIHYIHAKNCIYPASITNPPPCFFYSHRFCFPLCTTPRACNTLGRGTSAKAFNGDFNTFYFIIFSQSNCSIGHYRI